MFPFFRARSCGLRPFASLCLRMLVWQPSRSSAISICCSAVALGLAQHQCRAFQSSVSFFTALAGSSWSLALTQLV